MPSNKIKFLAGVVVLALSGWVIFCAASDVDDDLMAKHRVFALIGPGLRALRHGSDGKYYLLASPNVGIAIFDASGKQLSVISPTPSPAVPDKPGTPALVSFGEDLDVDSQGNLYVADRSSNQIKILSPDGRLLRSIDCNSPLSIAALPEGEVAVTEPRGD